MYKRYTLDNGIPVVFDLMYDVHSAAVGVWVKIGSRDESEDKNGISHFIEHMFFKGTKTRTAQDIAIEIDSIGGELNAFTSKEETTFYTRVLDEHLTTAIDLLADIFLNSVIDVQELEKEKRIIIEEIKMVEDTPDEYVHDLLYEVAWGRSALGRPVLGRKETVISFSRDDLVEHIKNFYTSHDIVIAAAGNINPDSLFSALNRSFGKIPYIDNKREYQSPQFSKGILMKKKKLKEVHICIGVEGIRYDNDDRYAVMLLNAMFGGSVSSRLFQEVRENRGLVYTISSYPVFYRDTGLLITYAGTGKSKAREVIRLIIQEMRKLKEERVKDAELRRAKEHIKGGLLFALESTSHRMVQIARHEIYFGRQITTEKIVQNIEDVTTEKIQEIAESIFKNESIAITVCGAINHLDLKEEDIKL